MIFQYVGDTGKGDSYLSELMRIIINGENDVGNAKSVQVILKCIPKSVSSRLTFRNDEFFRNEINLYNIILPALLEFQSSKDVKYPFKGYVKLFLSYCDGTNDVIILEDATVLGYHSYAVRQEGINLSHCKVSIKAVAEYHALSFAMKDQKPEEFDKIRNAIFETYYDDRLWGWYERFWKRICGIAIDAVEKEYPNSKYVTKIKEFAVPERYKDMIKAVRSTYDTGIILHGDCWTNNFLYKYIDGEAVEAKIIDFQISRCASPVLDLSFFIYACTDQEIKTNHYDDLLKYYHEVLSTHISEMGSDPNKLYPWDTFMEEVKKFSFFGLAFSFESTPSILLQPDEAADMDLKVRSIVNLYLAGTTAYGEYLHSSNEGFY